MAVEELTRVLTWIGKINGYFLQNQIENYYVDRFSTASNPFKFPQVPEKHKLKPMNLEYAKFFIANKKML